MLELLEIVDFVLSTLVSTLCSVGAGILFISALLSWVAPDAEGSLFNFIFNVSDFLTAPVRHVRNKAGLFAGSPIDFSLTITMILLAVVGMTFSLF